MSEILSTPERKAWTKGIGVMLFVSLVIAMAMLAPGEAAYQQELDKCEKYWNEVNLYLNTDGQAGWPQFGSECQPENKP